MAHNTRRSFDSQTRFKDVTIVHTSTFFLQSVILVPMHMLFHCIQREMMKLIEPLNLSLNKIHIEKLKQIEEVNLLKLLFKYNTMLYHSYNPIKATLAESFI